MTVDRQFIRIQKRDRGGKVNYDRRKVENCILLGANQMGGFQRFIIPEGVFGRNVMLDYRERTDAEIIHSIADKVEMKLDFSNQFPMAVNAPLKFANQQYMPAIEEIQDAIIYTLWESGFLDIAEYYLYYRSIKGLIRLGEINPANMTYRGYPSREYKESLEQLFAEKSCESIQDVNALMRDETKFREMINFFTTRFDSELLDAFKLFKEKASTGEAMIIQVTGKSSSGKTTTTKRFCDLVEKEGYTLLEFPVDNYFTQDQPIDPRGDVFYELPESLDLELLNEHLHKLVVKREAIELPYYDFKTNTAHRNTGNWIRLEKNQAVVIDSHQALFLTRKSVPKEQKFSIYLEPFNPIRDTDGLTNIRKGMFNMMGRWLRDKRIRGTSYEFNIPHWQKVRLGELRDIVPRMNEADVQINTGFPFAGNYYSYCFKQPQYRLPDPKTFLQGGQLYAAIRCWQAHELMRKFEPVPEHYLSPEILPDHSIIREFIGGSCYEAK